MKYNEAGVTFDYILIENVRNLLSGGEWEEETAQEKQEAEAQYEGAALCSTDSGSVDEATNEDVFRTWMGVVLADLAGSGYDAEWTMLSASDFGAPHQRKRVFIVAYPNQVREPKQEIALANGQCSAIEPTSICQRQNTTSMAHTSIQRLPQWGDARFTENDQESARGVDAQFERCGVVAHTSSSGQQECNVTPITEGTGYSAWRKIAPGTRLVEDSTSRRERQYQTTRGESGTQSLTLQPSAGQSQSVLGGNFDGSADWMDRYRWPSRPGEQQYNWEPPRTIKGKDRVARLQALGNAIVVPCVEYIAQCIVEYYNTMS